MDAPSRGGVELADGERGGRTAGWAAPLPALPVVTTRGS
jgi:hypothetical protein